MKKRRIHPALGYFAAFIPTIIVGLIVLPGLTKGKQAPDFNDRVQLIGNSVYNPPDWLVDVDGGGAIAMEDEGVVYRLDEMSAGSTRNQMHREYVVGDGDGQAAFRIIISDIDVVGFMVGFYTEEDDPLGTTPHAGAWFYKPASGNDTDKVSLKTRNDGGTVNTVSNEFTVDSDVNIDLVVDFDQSEGEVTFHWFIEGSSVAWEDHTVTGASVPDDESQLHMSILAFTDEQDGTDEILTLQVWEPDWPAGD